ISDRLSARAAIEKEKAYFKHLFESLPFGVVVLNLQEQVLDCNTAFLDMFKFEKEAVLMAKINDLIVPDFLKEEGDALSNDVVLGKTLATETTRSTSDGKLLQVALNGQPTTLPDGSQIVFATYQDISERKKTEQALHRERDLMNALMDNIPDTIYFKDTASNFTRINKAQQKTLGVKTTEEAIGKSDFDFFDQAHAHKSFEEERNIMSHDKPMINRIEKIQTKGGWKWFSATKVPLKNDTNDIIGLAGISRDITELKQMEEVLRQNEQHLKNMNAEKDKLFSIIAHDLRSPFNSFIMLTDVFFDKEYGITAEDMKSTALLMQKAVSNLSDLLDNLLDWSRLQRGLLDIDVVEIELLPLLENVIEALDEMINAKQISIDNKINTEYQLWADRSMLNSIIRNLLANAVKFTDKGGKISIEAGIKNDYYKISITDNGIGMPDKIKNSLFKIDGKVGRKGTEGEATSGLGLILVKEFLEKQNGYIEVQSEENKGSTFTAYLPINTIEMR
ncbi:MAG: PAS domain-containing sensor histidine kinase, partial [Bacteroidales bacterium]|nr:PAS domain-containing sensor histidine kinase [Bacteroidales bacterium]